MNTGRRPFVALIVLVILGAGLTFTMQLYQGRSIRGLLGGRPPFLYYRELEPDLLDDYGEVVGIAHNAGNSRTTIDLARAVNADGIEIDVIALGDGLYAAHDSIPVWIGHPDTQPLTLDEAWAETADIEMIQLDFKSTASRDITRFLAWLDEHLAEDGRRILVSTRTVAILMQLEETHPQIGRLLSIGTPAELSRFQESETAVAFTNGVAIRESLLDEDSSAWFHDHDLMIVAWTVESVEVLNRLVRLDVDAVTTDNLAILELLSNEIEAQNDRPSRPATPGFRIAFNAQTSGEDNRPVSQ